MRKKICKNSVIRGDDLIILTNLSSLTIDMGPFVVDSLPLLTNLSTLHLTDGTYVEDRHLSTLKFLKTLSFSLCINISGECFSLLTNLRVLSLYCSSSKLDYRNISYLANLKILTACGYCDTLSDETIGQLTNLRELSLGEYLSTVVSFETITKLKRLSMFSNECSFVWARLLTLPNLTIHDYYPHAAQKNKFY